MLFYKKAPQSLLNYTKDPRVMKLCWTPLYLLKMTLVTVTSFKLHFDPNSLVNYVLAPVD
jgi:hypothetical protein